MADVEDEIQVIRDDGYKVYKRRWLVLLAATSFAISAGFYRARVPVVHIVYEHWGTSVYQVASWSFVALVMNAITLLPFGRMLDYYGIRRTMYLASSSLLLSHLMYAVILFDEGTIFSVPKKYRFGIYILANLILTLSYSCIAGLAAKVANDWFSKKETTIALVIPMATFEIVGAFAAYLVPQFIETTHDLYILAYLYLLSAGITCLSVLTCIQRSRPKLPPSRTLLEEASQSIAPLHEAIVLLLKSPRLMLAMFASALNTNLMLVLQTVLGEIMTTSGYEASFCGQLLLISYLISFVASLTAALFDRLGDYIVVSRYASILWPLAFAGFCYSLLSPGMGYIIVASNIMYSSGLAVLAPLQLQALLRASKGILLPDASMVAIISLMGVGCYLLCSYTIVIFGMVTTWRNIYTAPLVAFSTFIIVANFSYALLFRFPSKVESQAHMS